MRRVTGSYAARSSTVATCSPALKAQRADSDEHLLVFARLPEPGKTKTRLIPAWGADGAAAIYKLLAQQTMETSRQFAASRGCSLTVCFSGGAVRAMEEAFGSDQKYATQVGSDLGDKLTHAVEGAFAAGARRVVVIGTDCLELEPADLHAAFDSLASHQVVLGPATDGGYYLIGMSRFQPLLFHDIDWGSESVFSQTKAIAQQCGVDLAELRPHSDIDHPEDLLPVRGRPDLATRAPFDNVAGRISVVIPTLNEAEQLPGTLQALSQPDDRPDGHLEVIVVDGGSNDRTLEIAAEHGCKAFLGNRGRARQMNAGASVATGEYLLFLHADTRLPADYRNSIRSCLASGSIAGAFRLGIAGDSAGLRWVE
ncbi:MAG: TIGR04282 family arsenosugar biosynthesis glycosyltransferase, partial [Planctomycetales bacterium]|nr:TIGR04282 family arsenosugar biosynthesis glycosyltransferase [Planctomycetales bacterium]